MREFAATVVLGALLVGCIASAVQVKDGVGEQAPLAGGAAEPSILSHLRKREKDPKNKDLEEEIRENTRKKEEIDKAIALLEGQIRDQEQSLKSPAFVEEQAQLEAKNMTSPSFVLPLDQFSVAGPGAFLHPNPYSNVNPFHASVAANLAAAHVNSMRYFGAGAYGPGGWGAGSLGGYGGWGGYGGFGGFGPYGHPLNSLAAPLGMHPAFGAGHPGAWGWGGNGAYPFGGAHPAAWGAHPGAYGGAWGSPFVFTETLATKVGTNEGVSEFPRFRSTSQSELAMGCKGCTFTDSAPVGGQAKSIDSPMHGPQAVSTASAEGNNDLSKMESLSASSVNTAGTNAASEQMVRAGSVILTKENTESDGNAASESTDGNQTMPASASVAHPGASTGTQKEGGVPSSFLEFEEVQAGSAASPPEMPLFEMGVPSCVNCNFLQGGADPILLQEDAHSISTEVGKNLKQEYAAIVNRQDDFSNRMNTFETIEKDLQADSAAISDIKASLGSESTS